MPVRIKICGITRIEDARVAANLGVDALGFIFYPKSPRYIKPSDAKKIIRQLPPFISKVGVFVDATADEIIATVGEAQLDTIQLHGTESPEFARQFPLSVVKAFSVQPGWDLTTLDTYKVSGYLLDTWEEGNKGGTGKTFDWSVARRAVLHHKNIILAGGLGPVNLEEALDSVCPYGVDLNSGLEIKPGVKNPHKMQEAVQIVRAWK